jgi:hypothetical protein
VSKEHKIAEVLRSNFVRTGEQEYTHPDFVPRATPAKTKIEERVAAARALGFSQVCAMCEHLWAAMEAGRDGCGLYGCHGPKSGGEFEGYRGPWPREYWRNLCVVCGKPSVGAFRVKSPRSVGGTVFGVCDDHKNEFGG